MTMKQSEIEKEDSKAQATVYASLFNGLLSNPKVIFGVLLMYGGVAIPVLLKSTDQSLLILIENNLWTIGGIVSVFAGILLVFPEMSKQQRLRREQRFTDVDDARASSDKEFQVKVYQELESLKSKTEGVSLDRVDEIVHQVMEANSHKKEILFDSFEDYFNSIRSVLLEQARVADKKASILLDKGTAYSKAGITFFVVSIISWQLLAWWTEFKPQYIYGIVSCSLLFIFIEFLAAWFLKQYRHFVDTSTYLIKVKSIFDKYMLSFLAIKTLGNNSDNQDAKYQAMLKVLEDDIKWPEAYLFKNGDVSFAKEALETMTHFAKAMKSEVKNNRSNP
ncbi:hypothetical protein [Vibrio campbellii]|uniref:hypothetical protein n=1 Tax=Vibrio campbellii TaxID=680 RepID=UPI0038CD4DA1